MVKFGYGLSKHQAGPLQEINHKLKEFTNEA